MPTNNPLSINPVYENTDTRSFSGDDGDYMDAGHHPDLELQAGTISLSFSVAHLPGDKAIISKDGRNREDGGHFTVWVKDGTLVITQESATETEWLKVPDLVLSADQTYHLGLSFGDKGLMVWLDGELVAAEPEFKQGIDANDRSLVIGGSRSWRDSDSQSAHSLFEGEIGDVMVFGTQLGGGAMRALANAVDPALDTAASMAAAMEDLLPVLGDMHHGSDTLNDILMSYGATDHGHMMPALEMAHGSNGNNTLSGTAGRDGINGWGGDDSIDGAAGDDVVQGYYGNDTLNGGAGNDILDGGHGEDRLVGGAGNDLLISRADGREGAIYPDPDRDEGDPYNELTNGKLYPDQPIPADDVLEGGDGADIFYFQTLINAKERYIEEHTRDDGTINWHGVAGENDKLHDHWVDILGKTDVVMDYDRDEGDRIVIEGHTTEIASITYGDVNGDGIMDHSIIELYSDQGNGGGAHNDDRLGNIKVYGDLVKESDIEHTAAPAYGIVHTIDDLAEAITPIDMGTDAPDSQPPSTLPGTQDLNIGNLQNPVFGAPGMHAFSSEDRAPLIFANSDAFDLVQGTIAMNFRADELDGHQVLFSKDASGYGNGGHITAYLDDSGTLTVRFQDQDESFYLKAQGLVSAGMSYDLAITFGEPGIELLLDGARVAFMADVVFDWTTNTEALIVGASGWNNTPGQTDRVHSHFNGTISDFFVFDEPLTSAELIAAGFGTGDHGQLGDGGGGPRGMSVMGTFGMDTLYGGNGNDTISAGSDHDVIYASDGGDEIWAGNGNDTIMASHGDDLIGAGDGDDQVWAGHGDDTVFGGNGADEIGGSDGDDDMYGGAGVDSIYGGDGADNIYAGSDDDLVMASTGDDAVFGDDGNDEIWTGHGTDTIDAGNGDDVMGAFNGDDEINAGAGNDTAYGGRGNDTIHGGDGDDQIFGVHDDDLLYGEAGNDEIWAGNDNDTVLGGSGNDTMWGGAGDDEMNGGGGDDLLFGGAGSDTFIFSSGLDRIEDFDVNPGGDQVDLSGVGTITDFGDLTANHLTSNADGDAVLVDGNGNELTLVGVTVIELTEGSFLL